MSKSESMNQYLESRNFQTIEEKAIVSFFVKQEYFFWDTLYIQKRQLYDDLVCDHAASNFSLSFMLVKIPPSENMA